LHGFEKPFVKTLCSNFDLILVQEHWLLSAQLHKYGNIDNDFSYYAVSAMESKAQHEILKGRPFCELEFYGRKALAIKFKLWEVILMVEC